MDRINNVKFIKSCVDYSIGASESEVAFVGRSNVGKSSVINAICGRKKLALTSQVPGKTRSINVYETGKFRWLVDLPGYGYAAGPEKERRKWQGMIEGYLTSRNSLKMVYLIVDVFTGISKLDRQMAAWLQSNSLPYTVIGNKADKLNTALAGTRLSEISQAMETAESSIFWVSARLKTGIPALVGHVARQLSLA